MVYPLSGCLLFIISYSASFHFTKEFLLTTQIRWKLRLAVIQLLTIRSWQLINLTNPTMHLSHIPQFTIQNRNVHISFLNGVLWDMEQVHCRIWEIVLFLAYATTAQLSCHVQNSSAITVFAVSIWQQNEVSIEFELWFKAFVKWVYSNDNSIHYHVVTMGAMASQITSLKLVYLTIYSDADQRKHQSSASLAFVRGIHRGPVNFPHKWPVTRKMFPFDEVIMW